MAVPLVRLLAIFKPTNLIAIVLLGLIGYGGLVAWRYRRQTDEDHEQRQALQAEVSHLQEQNVTLQQTVKELEAQRRMLESFVQRLTTESRVATVRVLELRQDPDGDPVYTIEFTEYDRQGQPLPSRIFDCVGKEVYFDALVIKFSNEAVKTGDLLRGKSLHLFRRAFGSAEEPRNGPLISTSQYDDIPNVYRLNPEHGDFEARLWRLFWHLAAHPKEAQSHGIRVNEIEAKGIRPVVGATYEIRLEHDGGLNIKLTEPPLPAPKRKAPAPPPLKEAPKTTP